MKRKLSFVLIIGCCLIFSACSSQTDVQGDNQNEPIQIPEQNSAQQIEVVQEQEQKSEIVPIDTVAQSNFNNDYLFLAENGWIYGRGINGGYSSFVKMRTDLSDFTTLNHIYALYPQLSDNYLYFVGVQQNDECDIYKMRTSGEDIRRIVKNGHSVQVVGNYLYYADEIEHHFYRCDLEGTNQISIIDKAVYFPFVFNDMIIYQDDADGETIHICDLDGGNDRRITSLPSYYPVYDGEFVYYVADNTIHRVLLDGTDDQEIASYETSRGMLAQGDYLYFVYSDDSNRLYRMKKDGSGIELVTQDTNVGVVQFFGTGLKYSVFSDGYENVVGEYFCELNGGEKVDYFAMLQE